MKHHTKSYLYLSLATGIFSLPFCTATAAVGTTEEPYYISSGLEFSHGDYGTSQSTDSYRIPVSINYDFTKNLNVSLGVSYLYQSNNATVSLGGGRFPMHGQPPAQSPLGESGGATGTGSNGSGGTGGMPGSGGMGGSGGTGGTGGMPGSGGMGGSGGTGGSGSMDYSSLPEFSDESQQGFGDITLTADYALPLGGVNYPAIRAQFYTKLPTADENKGLGTGAYDYGAGLSAGKVFGDWLVYTKAMYVFTGSTTDYRLDNYWTWLVSGDYPVTSQLLCGIELSGATSPFENSNNVLDLRFNSSYRFSNRGSLGTYVAAGLSEGSADYGIGMYATVVF